MCAARSPAPIHAAGPDTSKSARGGTLFLDEIGELPLAMQAALLRVLEDGSFLRVGSSEPRRARCRVVAATHRNLAELVEQGRFRQDLYFRVKILQKTVKPLRERPCDIALLARQFVKMLGVKHGLGACGLTAEAAAALERYHWPGNARELRNVIEAALLCSAGDLTLDCLPPEIRAPQAAAPARHADPSASIALPQDQERRLIGEMLRKYRKASDVAKVLGIARSTLYRRFAELQIDPRDFTTRLDEQD